MVINLVSRAAPLISFQVTLTCIYLQLMIWIFSWNFYFYFLTFRQTYLVKKQKKAKSKCLARNSKITVSGTLEMNF